MLLKEAGHFLQEGFSGLSLAGKLASFLKTTIQPDQARSIIRKRLERRDDDFFEVVKKCIYDQPESPYLKLLGHAGCEYGDINNLVRREGLEGALHELFSRGVYLTSEEFRGNRETVRGNTRFWVNPKKLQNPLSKGHVPIRSSGSRSHGTRVARSLDFICDNTNSLVLYLEARQNSSETIDFDSRKEKQALINPITGKNPVLRNNNYKNSMSELATWSVPGGVTLSSFIKFILAGSLPSRWFSQLDVKSRELSIRYQMSTHVLKWGGLLAGIPIPPTEYVSLDDPLPIIHWMKDCLDKGRIPHLFTYTSAAVRLAQCALVSGIDLHGAQITISGEPTTPARLESIKCSRMDAVPAMGCVEVGHIAYGCLTPEAPDDMHLLKDLHAAIQPGKSNNRPGLRPQALLFSTLRLSSPLILINVSLGDQATLKKGTCGCFLGELGLDTHLQYVRSFEKLTSGGMAFLDTEIVQVIEQDLPRRFGGGPTDYQLLEDERDDGKPQLRLIIHPRVGPLDLDQVKTIFLQKIASGSGAEKLTSLIWRDLDMVTIERSLPKTTATGKIQHMHIERD